MKDEPGFSPLEKEELLRKVRPHIRRLAWRQARRGTPDASYDVADLEQEGMMGAYIALDRFDWSKGDNQQAFILVSAQGCMQRYVRDRGAGIRVPRAIFELGSRMMRELGDLDYHSAYQRFDELVERFQVSPKLLEEAYQHIYLKMMPISLDKSIVDEDSNDFYNFLIEDHYDIEHADRLAFIRKRLLQYPEKQRAIFFDALGGMTQVEVGKRHGFSQMHISRIVRKIQQDLLEANTRYDRDGDAI